MDGKNSCSAEQRDPRGIHVKSAPSERPPPGKRRSAGSATTLTSDSTDHHNPSIDASCVVVQTAVTHTETGVASMTALTTSRTPQLTPPELQRTYCFTGKLKLLRFFFVSNRLKGARQGTNSNTRIPPLWSIHYSVIAHAETEVASSAAVKARTENAQHEPH